MAITEQQFYLIIIVSSLTFVLFIGIIYLRNRSSTKNTTKILQEQLKAKELLQQQLEAIEQQEKEQIQKQKQIRADEIKKAEIVTVKANKKSKETVEPLEYENTKGFDALKDRKSKLKLKYWLDWWKNKRHPETIALINMELLNGFHKLFLVKEREEGFNYRNKQYLFDNEAKYFIIDSKIWAYDYHEIFTLPIKRTIPVTNIRKTIEASKISEVEYATNPATLKRFAISKIAEGIMKGAQLDEVFKFLKLMTILIVVGVYIHLFVFMLKSGMLSSVSIPGIN